MTSYNEPSRYLNDISSELHLKKTIGNILFDTFIAKGNCKERFFSLYFNGLVFKPDMTKNINLDRTSALRAKTSEILFSHCKHLEDLGLNKYQIRLLEQGCVL